MKRMAALLAAMAALSATVPATAPAAVTSSSDGCITVVLLRFC